MKKSLQIKTLYIVGPTASGKSDLALDLAGVLDAEIICADSQTIRRDMNIGTAKPSDEERRRIPHHMLDIIEPYTGHSVYEFQTRAKEIIYDIHKRNKLVIVVGGTGLYVDSLYFNYSLPKQPKDSRLHQEYADMPVEQLQKEVASRGLDLPKNSKNPRHLINVLLRAGEIGDMSSGDPSAVVVGLLLPIDVLIDRINKRVEKMFDNGFVAEVHSLISKYGQPPREFDAIGYRIVMRHIDGEITEEQAKELFKIADRQYAKRQMSWFKRNKAIRWFDSPTEAKAFILDRV